MNSFFVTLCKSYIVRYSNSDIIFAYVTFTCQRQYHCEVISRHSNRTRRYANKLKTSVELSTEVFLGGERGIRSCFLLDISDFLFCNISQKASVTVRTTTHWVVVFSVFESFYCIPHKTRASSFEDALVLWRRERDSNPRVR